MTTSTLIRVTLDLRSRWSVGRAPEADETADLAITVDPRFDGMEGHPPYIPGSSLAGSLRRHLADRGADWLGAPPPAYEEERDVTAQDRRPSRLGLLGALSVAAAITTVGSTAIDGRRGAAAASTLRQGEWADPTTVVVAFEHEGGADDWLLKQLASWAPTVGRGRSSGMGRAAVTEVQWLTADRNVTADLTWWLTSRRGWLTTGAGAPPTLSAGRLPGTGRAAPSWSWTLEWELTEPLHVGCGDVQAGQPLPMARLKEAAIVPGSAWRGLFRHRIEAILSVLPDGPAAQACVVAALFGHVKSGRGLLQFVDSIAAADANLIVRSHVAIDRFTGGAREGALYQMEALDRGNRLTQTIESEHQVPEPVVNLLRHVVRDLHDGYLAVGGMGSRGYGSVRLTDSEGLPPCRGIVVPELLDALATTASASHPSAADSDAAHAEHAVAQEARL